MKLSHPNASAARSATSGSRLASEKPLAARKRAVSRTYRAPRRDLVGTTDLVLERRRSRLRRVGRNPLTLEIVGDQQIAGASRRELRSPCTREPPVIDEPGALCRLDRLAPHRGAACPRSVSRRSSEADGVITGPQRPQRGAARLEAAKRPAERARRRPVELRRRRRARPRKPPRPARCATARPSRSTATRPGREREAP